MVFLVAIETHCWALLSPQLFHDVNSGLSLWDTVAQEKRSLLPSAGQFSAAASQRSQA